MSVGTINPLRAAWDCRVPRLVAAGEGKHGISRRATRAVDKFPCSPKNPLTRRGLLGTIWLFFPFLSFFFNFLYLFLSELSVQKSTEDYRNWREQNVLMFKKSDFYLFQVFVMISVFCNHFVVNCLFFFFYIHSNGYIKIPERN